MTSSKGHRSNRYMWDVSPDQLQPTTQASQRDIENIPTIQPRERHRRPHPSERTTTKLVTPSGAKNTASPNQALIAPIEYPNPNRAPPAPIQLQNHDNNTA